ncbi:pyruvate dehydrogenase phosphatase regulatory subunit, mitochondrial-like [Agrilus planipennis]|uniref:Pyruvate dehydrogenase phosphatase regulatory subunit, mitochondrial-like n=1 Tax=Agrilus planipennis TaxID=224129 RepID=A0A7F5RLU9_AGRPL|nr:pyruvate dehydrogenase phosphatase regulatory subunit, mitochondrial-like [Agrilus planipennis]
MFLKCNVLRFKLSFQKPNRRTYFASNETPTTPEELPKHARVVICGRGVMGESIAYHLAKLGWGKDTVILEQSKGHTDNSWNSSGLIGAFKPTLAQVKLAQSSIQLYKDLEAQGHSTGWKQCGSLNLARTKDRMTVFRRMRAQSILWKIECELLTPKQCKEKCPLLNISDIEGALWIPNDGVADGFKIGKVLISEAVKNGVKVIENCKVTKVYQTNGKVTGVMTELGEIKCDYFVNCAGIWARDVGQLSDPTVKVPLHAVEHHYLHTKLIPGLDPMTPGNTTCFLGGVGQATAELIKNGNTSFDMYEIEVSRFLGLHNNRKFLRDRVKEVVGLHYGLIYPYHEFKTGRNLRTSPVYPKFREFGAVFGQVMGYERPNWFDPDIKVSEEEESGWFIPYRTAYTNTFKKPPWFDLVSSEYEACRERIGISDYSSFTKIDLWSKGNEVVNALQYVCSNDVDVPLGNIIHTGMQNHHGGYENDCSLIRLSDNHYMMVAPSIQQTRCKVWLQKHLPSSVAVSDVTSMFTALCIIGPFTRTMLSELTDTDLSPKNFPFFTYKLLDVGLANGIRTLNITHTGELGYVLYIPNEYALHVYSRLMQFGKKYGLKHAGYYATRALRIEKFYAFWGQDLDTRTTPLECGRMWRVKFDKNVDFIGKDALLKQREEGVQRIYVQLILEDHNSETDLWPWGGEPFYRNGKCVGICTTSGYGFTFQKQVCLGFIQNIDDDGVPQKVTNEYVLSGDYEVDIAGIRYKAKVNLHSPKLPTKFPDIEREAYFATRDKHEEPIVVTRRKSEN